ncbi:MAG: rod-binding protein [Thermodesulfovibrionales bacterium]|nr:rod-binding protein [Thermodesulfovibrionales bacterium]
MSVYNIMRISNEQFIDLHSLKEKNDPQTIKTIAKEMECLFLYELFKSMRKTVSGFSKRGLGADIYMGLFDFEVARLCAERGIGIGEMLVKNLFKAKYKTYEILKGVGEKDKNKVDDIGTKNLKELSKPMLPIKERLSSTVSSRVYPIDGGIRFHGGIGIKAPLGMPTNLLREIR